MKVEITNVGIHPYIELDYRYYKNGNQSKKKVVPTARYQVSFDLIVEAYLRVGDVYKDEFDRRWVVQNSTQLGNIACSTLKSKQYYVDDNKFRISKKLTK